MNESEIKNSLKEIIRYSQDIKDPKVDRLYNLWELNKKKYIELFNNKLIYEIDNVSVFLNNEVKEKNIEKFCSYIFKFLPSDEYFLVSNLVDLVRVKLYDNIVPDNLPEYFISHNITPGMKISKAFKFCISDPDRLDMVQTYFSRMLQEQKVTGTLCFSVHPLDYLSISENDCNWRSCHALDGDYRAGNLAYMIDKSTVVCYLREKEEKILPNFPDSVPWNSKKWRMLLFNADDDNALFAGRHYPFFSKELMEMIRVEWVKLLNKKFSLEEESTFFVYFYNRKITFSHWHNEQAEVNFKEFQNDDNKLETKYVPFFGRLHDIFSIITNSGDDLHFNDLLHSSCYTPYYCWKESPRYNTNVNFSIGNVKVPCLNCGENRLYETDSFLCESCKDELMPKVYCDCCGIAMNPENENTIFIEEEGVYVCSDCYESYFAECPFCGEVHRTEDMYFDEDRGDYICYNCHEELMEDN